MTVELVKALLLFASGGGLVKLVSVLMRWRSQSRELLQRDAETDATRTEAEAKAEAIATKAETEALVTRGEIERKGRADLIAQCKSELSEQAARHRTQLDEQGARHKREIQEAHEQLRAQTELSKTLALDTERERSRRREAERERDEAREREAKALAREAAAIARTDKAERELEHALASINQHAELLRLATDQIKRDYPSGEHPAAKR